MYIIIYESINKTNYFGIRRNIPIHCEKIRGTFQTNTHHKEFQFHCLTTNISELSVKSNTEAFQMKDSLSNYFAFSEVLRSAKKPVIKRGGSSITTRRSHKYCLRTYIPLC